MEELHIYRDTNTRGAQFSTFTLAGVEYQLLENADTLIPTGRYRVERDMYYGGDGVGGKKDYPCFEYRDIPGRSEIKFHIANYPHQIRGCQAPGLTRDENIPAVWSSGDAFEAFMKHFEGVDAFDVIIHEPT